MHSRGTYAAEIPHAGRRMGRHLQREYAAKCLPSHGSLLPPSRTHTITVLNSAAFQTKGGEGFSRRSGIQKKPPEMHISLRQKGALKADTRGREATAGVYSVCVSPSMDHASTVMSEGARLWRGAVWAACVGPGGLRLSSGGVQVSVPSRQAAPASPLAAPPAACRWAPPCGRRAPPPCQRGPPASPAPALQEQGARTPRRVRVSRPTRPGSRHRGRRSTGSRP
jgi:hypothetical protein